MLFALVAGALSFSGTAQAHGSVVGPASRAYHCWEEWGSDHMNPAMADEDPMCWQAYQANPNTMWNWMSMLQDGLGGQFEARIPNGKLCSNNHPNFESLNNPGPWTTTPVGDNFTIHLYDQAPHGADYFKVYVSKQGFDPKTEALGGTTWTSSPRPAASPRRTTSPSRCGPPATPDTTSSSPSGRRRTSTRPT
ncbi:hypothetical protein SALBM217S_01233 [Streptomyces griseoloalbus]